MTAIARSATATEFIGTESVQGQASTDKRQSSEKDEVKAATAEASRQTWWDY